MILSLTSDQLERAFKNVGIGVPVEGLNEDSVLRLLKERGVSVKCGACMEIFYTGVTTNGHTCWKAR